MKVGLFFGSFNPIHTGHLIIANSVLNEIDIDKIWFIVSPQNPLKESINLLPASARLNLVEVAIKNNDKFSLSNVEFKLPAPSYTINTIAYLKEKYSNNEFSIIMGSDNFVNISQWKQYEEILANNIIVYQRPGFLITSDSTSPGIKILNSPLLEISSTLVRLLLKQQKSIRYFVPEAVFEEISFKNYYK